MRNDPSQPPDSGIDEQMVELYNELRTLVSQRMRESERLNHTLQPTEVVHEAYLRLIKLNSQWASPKQLWVMAAKVVWDVLVDYARRRSSEKRGGNRERLTISKADLLSAGSTIDVLDLQAALEKLEAERPRQAEVVVLRFFGGLKFAEIADLMGIRKDTAAEHWTFARAYLMRELNRE